MKRIVAILAVLTACTALALPAAASATSSSTCQAYNSQLCGVTPHNSPGTLPFTGIDVGLLVLGGGTLLLAGFGVRQLSRRLD